MKKISRRDFLKAAGVAAAAAGLTACGGSDKPASGNAGGSEAAAEIKVGVMGPLTGDLSVYGLAVVNGALLYLDKVNAEGGVNGKKINVIKMDEQGDATQAVNCFTQMVEQNVSGIIGDVTTGPTLAVVAESQEYLPMPIVTASATAEAVTYDAETDTVYTNAFRSTFTDPFQGTKMADYAFQKLGFRNAAIIYQTGADYNEGLAESFEAEFTKLGGAIVAKESYSEGDVDFKAQLTNIQGKNPEVVFCPNYYEDVGMILAQGRDVGITVPFLGGDGWDGVKDYATADELAGCFFCANYAVGASKDFEDAYKAAYGEEYPNGFAPLGYDAAITLVNGLKAAEEAGLTAGTEEYRQKVTDAIKAGTVEGVTGTFTFDEHNNPVKTAAIQSFKDGKPYYVENF